MKLWAVAALVLAVHAGVAIGQLSKAVADDSHVNEADNKYLQREAHADPRASYR